MSGANLGSSGPGVENQGSEPLPKGFFGPNSPTKRKSTSVVWQHIKRLKSAAVEAQREGFTHVCVFPLGEGRVCNQYLKVTKPHESWSTVVPGRHMASHTTSEAFKASEERKAKRAGEKVVSSLLTGSVSTPLPDVFKDFKMHAKKNKLMVQAQWYVYSEQRIAKRSFQDPYFQKMLRVMSGTADAPVLKPSYLKEYVRAEFDVFASFLRHLVKQKQEQALGNGRWAQLLHDGGTLDNHQKYQAFGMQMIDPEWRQNHVICVGFPQLSSGKDKDVAETLQISFDKIFGCSSASPEMKALTPSDIFGSAISDRAAKGVSTQLGLEEEICGMHDGDKLGQSAVGALVRKKDKKVINAFPEGQRVMKAAHKMGAHFTYGTRYETLWRIGDASAPGLIPHTKIQVSLGDRSFDFKFIRITIKYLIWCFVLLVIRIRRHIVNVVILWRTLDVLPSVKV